MARTVLGEASGGVHAGPSALAHCRLLLYAVCGLFPSDGVGVCSHDYHTGLARTFRDNNICGASAVAVARGCADA